MALIIKMEDYKNYALAGAVMKCDLSAIHVLLDRGADSNHLIKPDRSLVDQAIEDDNFDIVTSLVYHGANVHNTVINYIFDTKTILEAKDLLLHVIKKNKNIELVQHIFNVLVELEHNENDKPAALEIFHLLLEQGLPLDDFSELGFTPLHLSIRKRKIDFVSILLDRGADVNKTTLCGLPPLSLAVQNGVESVLRLLLRKGAKVNEKTYYNGRTPLHYACHHQYSEKPEIIYTLLEHGADVNILDHRKNSPVKYANDENKKILIKKIARLKFNHQYVQPENLKYIKKNKNLLTMFDDCLKELKELYPYNSQ